MTGAMACWCAPEAGRAVWLRGVGRGGHCKYQASKCLGKKKVSALVLSDGLLMGEN